MTFERVLGWRGCRGCPPTRRARFVPAPCAIDGERAQDVPDLSLLAGAHPRRIGCAGVPADERDDGGDEEGNGEWGDDVDVEGEGGAGQCGDQHCATAPAGTSVVVQQRLASARVVKSLNQLGYDEFEEGSRPCGGLTAAARCLDSRTAPTNCRTSCGPKRRPRDIATVRRRASDLTECCSAVFGARVLPGSYSEQERGVVWPRALLWSRSNEDLVVVRGPSRRWRPRSAECGLDPLVSERLVTVEHPDVGRNERLHVVPKPPSDLAQRNASSKPCRRGRVPTVVYAKPRLTDGIKTAMPGATPCRLAGSTTRASPEQKFLRIR